MSAEDGIPSEEMQMEFLSQISADPTVWWDNKWSKPTHLDLKHDKVALWLNNRHKPTCVDVHQPGMNWPAESVSTSIEGGTLPRDENIVEVGIRRNLWEDGRMTDAVDALTLLVKNGCHLGNNIFYHVLKMCVAHKDLVLGRRVHVLTINSGYEGDAFLATHLIGLYAFHGRLEEAMRVFSKVSTPSSNNWATIINACTTNGEPAKAIRLYRQMSESSSVEPIDRIYVAVLKACAAAEDLTAGKEAHARILASPGEPNIIVQTGLVNMYAKCGMLEDARSVFDKLPKRDVVTWTAMIAGYARQGMAQEALNLYSKMQLDGLNPPNSVTFVCLLQACASLGVGALQAGKQLHAQIEELGLQLGVVLGNSLVNMYAKCGSLVDARSMFDRLPNRNVVTWNALIAGYAQQAMGQEALGIYNTMLQECLILPDFVTFVCLLQACASLGVGALHQGKQIHVQIEERGLQDDVVIGSSLVNMYAKCGSLDNARSVFDRLPDRDVVTWNAIIAGYTQQGMGEEALSLYSCMQKQNIALPNSITFACLLQACASEGVGGLHYGKQIHAQIEEQGQRCDVVVGSSLVNMYAKCGSLEHAHRVFESLADRDVVTWTAMIGGYAEQGMGQKALNLYHRMQQEGIITPNSATFVCLLQACAIEAALPLGKQLHAQIEERGLQADAIVAVALIDMYAKCGSMFDSEQVFNSLPKKSIEAWNALTGGYTRQADSGAVLKFLDRMRQEGMQPDSVTFLIVLTMCSHVGLVDEGRKYFEAMRTDYGIRPSAEHYRCLIDLLGRAGHLDEALRMAKTMCVPGNNGVVWRTLLGACRKWNNVEIGQKAFEFAVAFDGKDAASYALISNIYASAQMWEKANEMEERRVTSGAWRKPGLSWCADMGGVVHTFVVGDTNHSENFKLCMQGCCQIDEGYPRHLASSLRDSSEKLAVA